MCRHISITLIRHANNLMQSILGGCRRLKALLVFRVDQHQAVCFPLRLNGCVCGLQTSDVCMCVVFGRPCVPAAGAVAVSDAGEL